MKPTPRARETKSTLAHLGGHMRDFFIRAFPLEMWTERRLKVRLRNRSELSVYCNIFVERIYPFDRYQDRLPPTDSPVVLDVGANTGLFTAAVFDHWPRARVHAFEPQRKLVPRIRELAALNGLEDRITINWCAVGGSRGEAEFFQNRNPISASLLKEKAARRSIKRVDRVPVTTLDDYAQAHGLTQVDLLKLDVEGVELDVLRSATNLLRRTRLIFLEVHPPFCTYSAAARLLNAAGFVSLAPRPEPDDHAKANCVFAREKT